MTTIYADADCKSAFDQKNKIFRAFLLVTLAYTVLCATAVIVYAGLPYKDPAQEPLKAFAFVLSALYALFVFPFLGIKYARARHYFRMVYFLSEGKKTESEDYFVRFAQKDLQKDHVDVIACVFKTWSKKKGEWMEREVYLDCEKRIPDFLEGDLVRYVSQSNFLLQYEVVERKVQSNDENNQEKT